MERVYNVEPVDYEGIINEEKPFADNVANWFKHLEVGKILDVGCGPGIYVDSFINVGIKSIGYDADPRVKENPNCRHVSMFDVNEKAECVICFEVAEHIHEDNNDDIVDALYNMMLPGGRLVFSAAQPGQGGEGHINCKAPLYWMEKFLEKGLHKDDWENVTMKAYLLHHGCTFGWFINNAMVFKKP